MLKKEIIFFSVKTRSNHYAGKIRARIWFKTTL